MKHQPPDPNMCDPIYSDRYKIRFVDGCRYISKVVHVRKHHKGQRKVSDVGHGPLWTLLLMEAFLKTIKDRPEAQTVSSGLPHQSSDQGAAAIGSHFSNPIFFVYHGELPRLPYCSSQPNSIKLPLP